MTPEEIKPIAKVINNNQKGWENIVETEPNITLPVGTELFTIEQLKAAEKRGEEKAMFTKEELIKILYWESQWDVNEWSNDEDKALKEKIKSILDKPEEQESENTELKPGSKVRIIDNEYKSVQDEREIGTITEIRITFNDKKYAVIDFGGKFLRLIPFTALEGQKS